MMQIPCVVYILYIDTFTKAPAAGTQTITNARGVEINLGLSAASSTVTNAYGIYLNVTTDENASVSGFTTGYGLWIQNEGVGGYGGLGTGQMLDAGIYLKATTVSTPKAFNYGIDMSGAADEINTADIRLSSGSMIMNGADPTSSGARADGTLYLDTTGQLWINDANYWWQVATTTTKVSE